MRIFFSTTPTCRMPAWTLVVLLYPSFFDNVPHIELAEYVWQRLGEPATGNSPNHATRRRR